MSFAIFDLTPDGNSIHTFEISMRLPHTEYREIKQWMYGRKGGAYEDSKGRHYYVGYNKLGVRVRIEHISSKNGWNTYYVRIIMNPRVLIEPEASYLGILPPKKQSVAKVRKAFQALFVDTPLDEDLDHYYLSRVDLCTNVRCDNKKLFRELVRVLRKLPEPPKYERRYNKSKNKKERNAYNKHYIRLHCKTHELIIYDKTYQLTSEGLVKDYEKLPSGVLRFEVHCERDYIQKVEKKAIVYRVSDLLWFFIEHSGDRLANHFSRCFGEVNFMRYKGLKQKIMDSRFSEQSKNDMIHLTEQLRRKQSVNRALRTLEKEGICVDGLLEKFAKLGISPIPLRENFCAESIPGPVVLLRGTTAGKVKVKYVKAKYR